jgi:3-hydroxyacyl-CoA dehydrogenase
VAVVGAGSIGATLAYVALIRGVAQVEDLRTDRVGWTRG